MPPLGRGRGTKEREKKRERERERERETSKKEEKVFRIGKARMARNGGGGC